MGKDDDGQRKARRKVWFHRARAVAWAIFGSVSFVAGWSSVISLVWFASVYANVVSDLGAAEAADDRATTERLDRIEEGQREILALLTTLTGDPGAAELPDPV